MAFRRTKAAISLKHVKMEEKLLWRAYRNSPTLFRTVPSQTPYGLPFLEIGGLHLSYPLLSQERVKLRTSNFVGTFTGSIGTKANENVENSSRGRIQGIPKIFRAPMYRTHCAVIFAIAQLSCFSYVVNASASVVNFTQHLYCAEYTVAYLVKTHS